MCVEVATDTRRDKVSNGAQSKHSCRKCVCVCFVWEESSVATLWWLLRQIFPLQSTTWGSHWCVQAAPSSCLYSSLRPVLPSSPCWLGPSVAPAWIAARPRSSCHCCAACAVRPPAWWGAARPEIRLGPLLCTLPGPPTGWAGEESGSRAPGTQCKTAVIFFCFCGLLQRFTCHGCKYLKLPHYANVISSQGGRLGSFQSTKISLGS